MTSTAVPPVSDVASSAASSDDLDLRRRAAGGAVSSAGGHVVRVALQLVAVVVLARLLSPQEYGLVAIAVAVVGAGEVIRDMGLSAASVQSEGLSRQQRDNLLWLSTSVAACMCVGVLLLSDTIAAAVGEPRVGPVLDVLSVCLLLNGLAAQYRAGLQRALRFTLIVGVDLAVQAVALAAALGAALLGAGAWSLVVQQVVGALLGLCSLVAASRWLPGPPRRGADMRALLSYGSRMGLAQMVGYASRNIDTLVLGALHGAGPTGIYSRGFQLFSTPLGQVNAATTVALPVLSRRRHRPAEYEALLLRGHTVMAQTMAAVFGCLAVVASPLVDLLLGPGWSGAAVVLQLLCVGGVFQSLTYSTYWALTSQGLMSAHLRLSLGGRLLQVVVVCAGATFGLEGAAVGYSLGLLLLWPLALVVTARCATYPTRPALAAAGRAVVGHGAAWVVGSAVLTAVGGSSTPAQVLCGAGAYGAALLAVTAAWPGFRRDVQRCTSLRRLLLRGRGPLGFYRRAEVSP